MEKPVDLIRGILESRHDLLEPPPKAAFLCSFDRFCWIQILVMKHGFVDQFAQNGCTRFPLAALGLKPSVRLRADIDYDLRHGIALVCSDSVP